MERPAEFFGPESTESPSFCDRDFCDRGAHKVLRAHRQGEAPRLLEESGRAVWRNGAPVKSYQARSLPYTKGGEGVSRSGISTQAHGEVGVRKVRMENKELGEDRPSITKGFPRNSVAQRCLWPRTLASDLPWGREGGGNIGRTCLSDSSTTRIERSVWRGRGREVGRGSAPWRAGDFTGSEDLIWDLVPRLVNGPQAGYLNWFSGLSLEISKLIIRL